MASRDDLRLDSHVLAASRRHARNRDRGWPRGHPSHTTVQTVRTWRFDGLDCLWNRDGREAERCEDGIQQSNGERGAVAEPPRAMRASGSLRRRVPADAAASQLGKASRPAFPLLPGDGTQPSPDPLVKLTHHRRGLAEVEVATPSDRADGQVLDDQREAPCLGYGASIPAFGFGTGPATASRCAAEVVSRL